jgi:uncharacterized protein YjeT (DUF2065 family)
VGIGSWEWFVEIGQELSEDQTRLLGVCSMAIGQAVKLARREWSEAILKN